MPNCQSYADIINHLGSDASNPHALNQCREDGSWQAISTEEFLDTVKMVALGLCSMGLNRGDRIGIYAAPSPQWTIVDMAIALAGGVIVPILDAIADDNFAFEATHAKLKIIFVDGMEQWAMFQRYEPLFDLGIAIGNDYPEDKKIRALKVVIDAGKKLDDQKPELYSQLVSAIRPHDLGAIYYTSGSTGIPKGVELTQLNLVGGVEYADFDLDPKNDRFLSILPLAHVFGHCFSLWMLYRGVSLYYTHDYKRLVQICHEVRPTIMAVVPRLLEKTYIKMAEKIRQSNFITKSIGRLALHCAHEQEPSFLEKMLIPFLDKLVYSKFRSSFGGKLRLFISGGAPLSPRLQHFFYTIGIPAYQGWGMTEACPLSTTNPVNDKIGTVGKPLPGQIIKIGDDGEILAKGTLVMRGYYEEFDKTGGVIDSQGYLHTGDKGRLDDEGYLTIIGRLKEIYKTSKGEPIVPAPLEQALCRNPLIETALIVAEGYPYVTCLLFSNHEHLLQSKKEQKAENQSDEEFVQSPFVRNEIDKLIENINQHLNLPQQIHGYRFILEPLTIKNGELTPSMKIRRAVVVKKYAQLIEEMYNKELS